MTKRYDLNNIRSLLIDGFDDGELRRLCHDEPDFRPVHNRLAHDTGKTTIIDWLLEHADQKLKIEALLTWAKEQNPHRYEKHQPYQKRAKTILILAANPQGPSLGHLNEEILEIQEELRKFNKQDEFIIQPIFAVRYSDVYRAISEYSPQIVHFSGYKVTNQGIMLEDSKGQTKFVSAEMLAHLFEGFPTIGCVLLNACYIEVQAEAIAQHIDYVVGMSPGVDDEKAIKFIIGFYNQLAAGQSIELAYQFGHTAVRMAGIRKEFDPVLQTRKVSRSLRSESNKIEFSPRVIDNSERGVNDEELKPISTPPSQQPSQMQILPPPDLSSRMVSLFYWFEDALVGGAERRLRHAVSRLESIFGQSTNDVIDYERTVTEYAKTMRLAMRIDPSVAVQLLKAYDSRISNDHYGRAFTKTDSEWIVRQIKRGDENILKVCMELTARLELQSEYRQAVGLLTTYYVNEGEDNKLITHLNRCLDGDLLPQNFLLEYLKNFVDHGGSFYREHQAWEGLFNRVFDLFSEIPAIFEVHLFLNRLVDAYRLATTSNQQQALLDSCLQAQSYEDICLGIKVAEELHDVEAIKRTHERAGDNRFSLEEYEAALQHLITAECQTKVSECYEQLNQPFEALQTCSSLQQDRLVALVDQCLLNDLMKLHEFSRALTQLNQIDKKLKTIDEPSQKVRLKIEVVAGQRQEILKNIRQHYSQKVEMVITERQQTYQEWGQLEGIAGEWEAAARLAEKAGDYDEAYKFFSLINKAGEAIRVLSNKQKKLDEEIQDSSTKIAEVNEEKARIHANTARAFETGGQPEAAAPLWEKLGKLVDARRCYEEAGDWAKAVYCLFQELGYEEAIESVEFDQLIKKADRPVKELVLPCIRAVNLKGRQTKAAQLLDYLLKQKATEELPVDLLVEARSAMETLRLEDRKRFEQQFPGWLKTAQKEIDSRYASIWGLDLGTTKCSAAIYDSELKRPIICKWKGAEQFSSTLCLDKEGVEYIGFQSDELFAPYIVGSISASKRKMGLGHVYLIGKERYRPEEIAARLIAHARSIVEDFLTQEIKEKIRTLANKNFGEVPQQWLDEATKHHKFSLSRPKVLVTIPAFFQNNQKHGTQDACTIAGVELVRLLHEPTAACVAASLTRGLNGRIVVIDLGAGTLDISEVEAEQGLYDVIQVHGNNNFGGKDFDTAITRRLATKLKDEKSIEVPMASLMMERLEVAAESLKIELSTVKAASYTLHSFGSVPHVQLDLSQSELENILAQPLKTLHTTCEEFRSNMKKKPDYLLIVGGPMLSSLVQKQVEEIFNLKATIVGDPRTIVARGAALQAGVLAGKLSETILLDVVPFRLGVRVIVKDKEAYELSELIQKNTRIPIEKTELYTTPRDNQTEVDVEIFQGELVEESRIGHFRLDGIPPAPKGEPKIEVTFAIDSNCVLMVTAKDKATGQSKSITISNTTLLSPAERDKLAKRFQQQKEHDRRLQVLNDTLNELGILVEGTAKLDIEGLSRQWRARLDAYQPSTNKLDSRIEQTLFEMFNYGHEVESELTFTEILQRDLRKKVTHFIANARNSLQAKLSLDEIVATIAESRDIQSQLENCISRLQSMWDRLSEWYALLVSLAITQTDPLKRFVACHDEKKYEEAVVAFKQIDSPQVATDSILRYLDCLGHLGDKEVYYREAANYGEELGITVINQTMLDQYCAEAFLSVAWVHVKSVDQTKQGTGFLVSDRFVVTSRSVVVNGKNNNWEGERIQPIRVYLNHAWRMVDQVIFPTSPRIDLALMRLVEPLEVKPFRIGYSNLIRLGQSVMTLGYKIADPTQQPVEIASVHSGIINEYEAIPDLNLGVFKVGLQLSPGLIGAPLINDLGEIIGIISANADFGVPREDFEDSSYNDRVSLALAVNTLGELLQEHL